MSPVANSRKNTSELNCTVGHSTGVRELAKNVWKDMHLVSEVV